MSQRPAISLATLDALIESVGFPVRAETLERAWQLTSEQEGLADEIMILVTLQAKPGRERELEKATQEFAAATGQLKGALGSTLYRSTDDPRTFTLVERFDAQEAIQRHVASDYFRRFQVVQAPLLAEPVRVTIQRRVAQS
jgi:quinol monooxygenase YgiN